MTAHAAEPALDPAIAGTAPTDAIRVLQRVVFPADDDLDVVPLYVETDPDRGAALGEQADGPDQPNAVSNAALGSVQAAIRFGGGEIVPGATDPGQDASSRRSAVVLAGQRVSFGTYFSAFPASYWRRWTTIEAVTLRLTVSGDGTVILYRSTARGHSHPVRSLTIDSSTPEHFEVTLPLAQFMDGGWYWFDIAAGNSDVTLVEADWVTTTERITPGRVSIGITTYNRPEFLLDSLRALGRNTDLLEIVDTIYVIDQGTDRVEDQPDFADATKPVASRLRMISQPNLGGSGGFSRAMDETVQAGASDYVLLLDDDVVLEPEGILRAVTFADLARRPTIVGGHMFSLYDRSVLHAFGETVAKYSWWWGAAPHTRQGHDFGRRNLRHTPWLHRRVDVDYNGWWMCLIPTEAVRTLGLALPVFIKWDDAEYGLRAAKAGIPTVSMPGVAVWHVPWMDKNDALDWQAYYHLRNRLLAALLHSPYDRGGQMVADSMERQIQHLLSMQYSTAELRLLAIEDILCGPDHLHPALLTKQDELKALRAQHPDAQARTDIEQFPPVRRRKPPKRGSGPTSPKSPVSLVLRAGLGAVRQTRPIDAMSRRFPQLALPYQDAQWWSLANVDSALVSTADGTSTSWYQRDPKRFRTLMQRSATLHAKLLRDWPALRQTYRGAAVEFTSPQHWRRTFGSTPE